MVDKYIHKRKPAPIEIAEQMRDIKEAITKELAFYNEKKAAKKNKREESEEISGEEKESQNRISKRLRSS
jgi:predicted GIY-YIG superfamily endonuclease